MNKTFQMVLVLGSISLVSGGSLASIFVFTEPIIARRELEARCRLAEQVLPGAEFDMGGETGNSPDRFEGRDRSGKVAGVVYVTKGRGYAGPIEVIVGIGADGTIRGVRVGKNSETPGLGSRITEVKYGEKDPWFTKQFANVAMSDFETGRFKLDAVTGATISSKAVASAVQAALSKLAHEPFYKKAD